MCKIISRLSLYEKKECKNAIKSLNILILFLSLHYKLKLYIIFDWDILNLIQFLQVLLPLFHINEEWKILKIYYALYLSIF